MLNGLKSCKLHKDLNALNQFCKSYLTQDLIKLHYDTTETLVRAKYYTEDCNFFVKYNGEII